MRIHCTRMWTICVHSHILTNPILLYYIVITFGRTIGNYIVTTFGWTIGNMHACEYAVHLIFCICAYEYRIAHTHILHTRGNYTRAFGYLYLYCMNRTIFWLIGIHTRMSMRLIHMIRPMHICDMEEFYVWYESCIRAAWLILECDMVESYWWQDSFMCIAWLIRELDISHSYVWCVLIQVCYMWYTQTQNKKNPM